MSLGDLVFEWLLLFKCQGSNRDLNNTCAAHGDVWGTNILTVRDKEASESSSNWAMMKTFSACIAGLWSCWSQWAVVQMYVSLHICNLLNHFLPEMCHLLSNIYFIFLNTYFCCLGADMSWPCPQKLMLFFDVFWSVSMDIVAALNIYKLTLKVKT